MAQSFQYPNLLSGTRSGNAWELPVGGGSLGLYNKVTGIELYNDKPSETFIYSPQLAMHTHTDYALSYFSASTANMSSTEFFVLYKDYNSVGANVAFNSPGPEGAWLDATFKIYGEMPDGAYCKLRFDNNGSTDGERCLIWFRDIMLVDGTEPRAWAPAEGETLDGSGALVSANALDGITPKLLGGTTKDGIWYETTAGGDCLRYQLDIPAHADNQAFNLAATVCGDSAGWLSLALEYADAAGHTNRAIERLDFSTEPARRKVSIVVPSGMAVKALYVSRDESQPASRVASITLWQGKLVVGGNLVLDVSTSGDIALDVRAGYR